jgi:hypothetical protein
MSSLLSVTLAISRPVFVFGVGLDGDCFVKEEPVKGLAGGVAGWLFSGASIPCKRIFCMGVFGV